MTYVRRALPGDAAEILPLARAFHAESPHHRPLPFSDSRVLALIGMATMSPDWCALVACDDNGAIVGLALYFLSAAYFSDSTEVYDLTFWVAPEQRKRSSAAYKLAAAVVKWAMDKGAVRINQGVLTGINHDEAIPFFKGMGFEPKGEILVRTLR